MCVNDRKMKFDRRLDRWRAMIGNFRSSWFHRFLSFLWKFYRKLINFIRNLFIKLINTVFVKVRLEINEFL